ncbi:hypothetical protein F2Q69_00050973 [Brassica cretica]|uniref:Uncharacterized protein n=1 Tax=Brassica cretica TaxID=69181 RepID=A0A8S9PV64_BRACR|nr:hypothetical protein F2Q69_00050973 [Brassica cretica]
MLQGHYGFGQVYQLEKALSHKAEAHNLLQNETTHPYSRRLVPSPVRQPNPNVDPPRPGPFPVRRPNPDPSGSSGNRIPNQAQNNSPNAARQCTCSRWPRCGNAFFDLPPENLFLTLFFCMLFLILIKFIFPCLLYSLITPIEYDDLAVWSHSHYLEDGSLGVADYGRFYVIDKGTQGLLIEELNSHHFALDEVVFKGSQERMEKEAEVKRVRAELLRKAREEDPLA